MHSRGMRTAHLLTLSQHALDRGGVSQHALGGGGGVCPEGECLPRVCVCVCVWQTPLDQKQTPPVDKQTPVKT